MTLDKLIYQRSQSSKEPQVIEFKINEDLTITEFKRTCKRMALALGYSNKLVEEHFGKDAETGDPAQLRLLFD